jgi:hypothetical protein
MLYLKMGYSEIDSMVRVDFFKESGKWYTTEAIDMNNWYNEPLIHDAISKAIITAIGDRLSDMTAVILEPYHINSHPVMISVAHCKEIFKEAGKILGTGFVVC